MFASDLKSKARALLIYGAYLIFAGLVGYLSNPEKAKTALLSGGVFGTLLLFCGALLAQRKIWAGKIGLGLCVFLVLVFAWRATVGWIAVSQGQHEKMVAAALISTMLVGGLLTIFCFIKNKPAFSSRDSSEMK